MADIGRALWDTRQQQRHCENLARRESAEYLRARYFDCLAPGSWTGPRPGGCPPPPPARPIRPRVRGVKGFVGGAQSIETRPPTCRERENAGLDGCAPDFLCTDGGQNSAPGSFDSGTGNPNWQCMPRETWGDWFAEDTGLGIIQVSRSTTALVAAAAALGVWWLVK